MSEAEEIADRVGVINGGEILLVENKDVLMQKLGEKRMVIELQAPCAAVPEALATYNLVRSDDGLKLTFTYDTRGERTGITALLGDLSAAGLVLRDLQTSQSSLEEIFVNLVRDEA